jgi:hypothetical protein
MIHALATFIFETLHLKHVKHEGWRIIGVEQGIVQLLQVILPQM